MTAQGSSEATGADKEPALDEHLHAQMLPESVELPVVMRNLRRPKAILTTGPVTEIGMQMRRTNRLVDSAEKSPASCVSRMPNSSKMGRGREIEKIEAPSTIGGFYDFGSILGRGGFGTVSEIVHAKTLQPFAGKVVTKASFITLQDSKGSQGLGSTTPGSEATFRKVVELLMNTVHKNIVRMLRIFEDDTSYYLVMNICSGGNLRKLFRSADQASSLPPRLIEDIMVQILYGVGFLHSMRFIHRDLKPENVMLKDASNVADIYAGVEKPRLCIVDFDMGCFLDESGEIVSPFLEGTPGYVAPEILETRRYNPVTDIYSCGCIAYAALQRRDPCPELSFSSRTSVMVQTLDRWIRETQQLCSEKMAMLPPTSATSTPSSGGRNTGRPNSPQTALPSQTGSTKGSSCPGKRHSTVPPLGIAHQQQLEALRQKHEQQPTLQRSQTPQQTPVQTPRWPTPPTAASTPLGGVHHRRERCLRQATVQPSSSTGALTSAGSMVMGCRPQTPNGQNDPTRLWSFVSWCLERDPLKRPASAKAILASGVLCSDASPATSTTASPCASPLLAPTPSRKPPTPSPRDKEGRSLRKCRTATDANVTSIHDLLKLSNSPMQHRPPKSYSSGF
eukprot:TRINITY_DN15317_c0_g1_i2.p1 TRINITY_DN15317_c0_g1~~TRINITY_DN15317_c0_g1_i2.p1  ORF type:complete len:637 (-),score=91.94 TRINITY_DN15317_c0_g1_i2:150-2009(-)